MRSLRSDRLSPPLDRNTRRALLLASVIGLDERPAVLKEERSDYVVFGALALLAAATAALVAIS